MVSTCPNCEGGYERLGQHWAMGSCAYPSISDYKKDLFTGLLMGDGCIGRHGQTPKFIIAMVKEEFLHWLDDELNWISSSVWLSETAEESAQSAQRSGLRGNVNSENYQDVYRLQTYTHNWFEELEVWYNSGKKKFPRDLSLNSTIAKMWYVSDGSLNRRRVNASVEISSVNESSRGDFLEGLFHDVGFEPTYREQRNQLEFTVEESKKFLEWIGPPVPGFEYKWDDIFPGEAFEGQKPWRSKDKLEELYIDKNLSASDVGTDLGCSADTVLKWVREFNLPVRGKDGSFDTGAL